MPKRTANFIPKLCHHKATVHGYVRLDKKPIYLGHYGQSETRQKYLQTIGEWELNGRKAFVPIEKATISILIDYYLSWAKTYYRK